MARGHHNRGPPLYVGACGCLLGAITADLRYTWGFVGTMPADLHCAWVFVGTMPADLHCARGFVGATPANVRKHVADLRVLRVAKT